MNKFAEFYEKVLADEAAKNKLIAILGDKPVDQASDETLEKVGALAKELGYDFTIEEAKSYLHPAEGEISDDALDEVAGGKGSGGNTTVSCENGIGNATINLEGSLF